MHLHVVKLLGSGGFGSVAEVLYEQQGAMVRAALKYALSPQEYAQRHTSQPFPWPPEVFVKYAKRMGYQFSTEAAVLEAAAGQPHIISMLASGRLAEPMFGCPAILMELALGGTLEDLLDLPQYSNGLPEPVAAEVMRQVLHGVASCIWRDAKPPNVLLLKPLVDPASLCTQPGAAAMRIKIADFGVSKQLAGAHEVALTQGFGTWPFDGPERTTPGSADDMKTDIWGCGMLLLMLLTGQILFTYLLALPEEECKRRHKEAAQELDRAQFARISAQAKAFLCRCFTVDVMRRPTAAQLLDDAFVKCV